jgi:hypothetical protein
MTLRMRIQKQSRQRLGSNINRHIFAQVVSRTVLYYYATHNSLQDFRLETSQPTNQPTSKIHAELTLDVELRDSRGVIYWFRRDLYYIVMAGYVSLRYVDRTLARSWNFITINITHGQKQ